jgi:hypothetical protein
MSGESRAFSSTVGSIFFASAWAAALSSTADKLVRNCTKMGADALYIEMVIGLNPSGYGGGKPTCQRQRSAAGRERQHGNRPIAFLASLAVSCVMVSWRLGQLAIVGDWATLRPNRDCCSLHHFRAVRRTCQALFIAMAALVPTAGEQFPIRPGAQAACRAVFCGETHRLNRRLPACALCCRRPPIYGQARQA